MATSDPKYLVFDIESVADGQLVSRLKYQADKLSREKAIARYRGELQAETGKDAILDDDGRTFAQVRTERLGETPVAVKAAA